MSTPLLFVDTETTGLEPSDHIWEFAAVRREPDGRQTQHHAFVLHDPVKAEALPPSFLADYRKRYNPATAITPASLVTWIQTLTHDRPHVVGAVPNFDTERLDRLARRWGETPRWHYHLIDVEILAVGWLAARIQGVELRAATESNTVADALRDLQADWQRAIKLPWDSDRLSHACGVKPPGEGTRHTALGDVYWAMELYDRVMGVS